MSITSTDQPVNYLSTEELAQKYLVKAASVRSAYCRQGHYCGHIPEKLANGRLRWPDHPTQN